MEKLQTLRAAVFLSACATCLPTSAWAQGAAVQAPDAGELPRPAFRRPEAKDGFQLPRVPAPQVAPASGNAAERVDVKRIVFRGNAAIPTEKLLARCADHVGRMVSVAELELLRQTLSRHYVEQGYLNSGVTFGRPAYADGTVHFEVIEGRLSQVRINGLAGLDEDYVKSRLVKPDDGPLNINELRERFQLLLDDPLFKRLNARITPDAKPGEAILDIDADRARPYQLTAFANNTRAPSIDSDVFGLRGMVANLTGRGDMLEGSVQSTARNDSGNGYGLTWDVPLNHLGTSASLHYDHGKSALIDEAVRDLGVVSILDTRQAGLSQVIHESLRHHFSAGLTYIDRESETTLLGMPFSFIANETTGTTKVRSWRFWQGYRHRTESRVLALRSTFALADTNLQSTTPALVTGRIPDASYRHWIGQAHYAQLLPEQEVQLVVRATGQFTPDRLLSLDGLSVGGMNSVRGYRENQFLRDNGYFLNFELEYPLVKRPDTGTLTLVPFFDYGRSWNRGEDTATLSSAGLAGRYHWNGLNLNIAWAKRIHYPGSIDRLSGNLQDKGFHFQVSYDFFGK